MTTVRKSVGKALLVVGMHRSGTSALTRVLNLHGADLGSDLLSASHDNEAGFWENRRVVEFHERLLSAIGSSWDDPRELRQGWLEAAIAEGYRDELVDLLAEEFSGTQLWTVKDPRLCRLLPMWLQALPLLGVDPHLIFALRDPSEVVSSLMRRNGLSASSAALLWLRHLAEPVLASRGLSRCAVDYHELLEDWRSCMKRVSLELDIAWPVPSSHCESEVAAHVRKDLQHQRAGVARNLLPEEWHDLLSGVFADAKALTSGALDWEAFEETLGAAFGRLSLARPIIEDLEPASFKAATRHRLVEIEQAKLAYQKEAERVAGESSEAHRRLEEAEIERRRGQELRQAMQVALDSTRELVERKNYDLESMSARIRGLNERGQHAEARIHDLELQIERLNAAVSDREQQLREVYCSHSWRSTAPLRWLTTTARSFAQHVRRALGALGHIVFDAKERARYWTLAKELGPRRALDHAVQFARRGGPSPVPGVVTEHTFDLRGTNGAPIVILTTKHCRFIAEALASALSRAGIHSNIIFEMPVSGYANVPHFVVCPQMFDALPSLYVAFQMEQSVSSRWFTEEYLRRLECSYAVFDYSLDNIGKLTSMGLQPKQLFYVPVGLVPGYGSELPPVEESYDVLFYGDINNERRRACIHALEKVCRVKVVSNLFGTDMLIELRRAKVVVNIHYYQGALLESTRLWECLSLGRLVVSERGSDMAQHEELLPLVDFVPEGDFDELASRVQYWLEHEDLRQARLADNAVLVRRLFNRFDYFFYRFLLATDNISFEDFWRLIGSSFPLAGDQLCLNLPEYVDRSASFDRDNDHGFERFPGLRHAKGWLGCAMSYKYMLRLARKHGLATVTICEDDVQFPDGFESRWAKVRQVLAADPNGWDVFSGVLADLSDQATVLSVEEIGDLRLVVIDRLISMVFNVYNASCYELIDSWDENNQDVTSNTIDRFLERNGQLRVTTTSPFLVGHKEELYSTLWGGQNTIYRDLIEKSSALLCYKADLWEDARRVRDPS